MQEKNVKKISLDEFKAIKNTHEVEAALKTIRGGGSFMCCHTTWFAATGMWIPELVPVFKKLDAMLATHELAVPNA